MILVVRVADSRGPRAKDAVMTEAGDVIECVPDAHQFTPAELGNPDYRFLRVAVLPIEADALRAADVDPITRRARRMRAQSVPLALMDRLTPGEIHDIARPRFLAAVSRKAAL